MGFEQMVTSATEIGKKLEAAKGGPDSFGGGFGHDRDRESGAAFRGEGGPRSDMPDLSVGLLSPAGTQRLARIKVKQSDLILFTTQLSVMLDSGVVLSDALDAIAEQAEREGFKAIIIIWKTTSVHSNTLNLAIVFVV